MNHNTRDTKAFTHVAELLLAPLVKTNQVSPIDAAAELTQIYSIYSQNVSTRMIDRVGNTHLLLERDYWSSRGASV